MLPTVRDDRALSPVIATVILAGIAVSVSAGVLTWVGGFGADAPAKPFPQLVVLDDDATCTGGAADRLFSIKHVGGESMRWSEYDVRLHDGAADHAAAVDWGGGAAGAFPAAAFDVGSVTTVTETTDLCSLGADEFWTLQFVAKEQENSVVYEMELLIT